MNLYTTEEYIAARKKNDKLVCGQQYTVHYKDLNQQPGVLMVHVVISKSAHKQVEAKAKKVLPKGFKIIRVIYS